MPTHDLLAGRTVVVTGSARGIGYAIASRMLASGASVALWALDKAALDEAAAGELPDVAAHGGRVEHRELGAADRLHQHQLVAVTEVADAEHLAGDLRQARAEREVVAAEGAVDHLRGVETLGHDDRGHGVGIPLRLLRADVHLPALLHRGAHAAGQVGVALEDVLQAFLLDRDGVIAIPKSSKVRRVEENRDAVSLDITEEDWASLDAAFPPPAGKTPLEMI